MNSAIERLLSLRVGDAMTRNVVRVPIHFTMSEAARLMLAHEVSGAPVVDDEGRCVGILSGTNFVAREQRLGNTDEARIGKVEHVLVRDRPDQPYRIEDVAEDVVENHMMSAVQTTTATATLMEAARAMCAGHIHRLVVLDAEDRPVGIVSSLDLVAALVKAVEE